MSNFRKVGTFMKTFGQEVKTKPSFSTEKINKLLLIYIIFYKTYRSIMSNFSKVGLFMKTFGQEVKNKPSFSTDKINKLRLNLIKEELSELTEAMNNKDLLEVADALTDILYVTYGAGHAFGINLDKCFEEVQNSNMSKLGDNGKPIYNEHGKVMKGPNYFKPDLKKFIN